jgi:tetratricopeptide (TPR) repeat protein
MGKNKILDATDKETVNSYKRVKSKTHSTPCLFIILLAACYLLLASGCGVMPKIIILDDPLSPEEHITLGVVYEKKGEIDNALKEYKLASKKLPLAYLYMGNIFFQKNELDEAESAYKKAIKKDPNNSDAYNNLAWLYYTKKENLDEAETLALKAVEINPSKKDIYQDTLEKIRELKGQK